MLSFQETLNGGSQLTARWAPVLILALTSSLARVESYVADDKTFCVYLATDEAAIRRHSEMSGFPADKITEIRATIDPSTAE
jgi:hypothetical protein